MDSKAFFSRLVILSLIVGALLFIFHLIPGCGEIYDFSILSLGFFILLSVFMFILGKRASFSANKNLFTSVVIGFVFGKLVLSLVIILIYHKLVHPVNGLYLIPFFIVYVAFTVFETHFLMQLGKVKSKP